MNVQGPAACHDHNSDTFPLNAWPLVLQGGRCASGRIRPVSTRRSQRAGIHPDWIAGISIGAINAAIIAGNPPNSPRRSAARVLDP